MVRASAPSWEIWEVERKRVWKASGQSGRNLAAGLMARSRSRASQMRVGRDRVMDQVAVDVGNPLLAGDDDWDDWNDGR